MAIQQKNTACGTYKMTQFPASKGIALLKQLTKLLGPSFAELSSAEPEHAMRLAIQKLVEGLDNVQVEELVKYIVTNGATKDGDTIQFDSEFAGNYSGLFNLCREIVEFNFGDVFTLLGSGE